MNVEKIPLASEESLDIGPVAFTNEELSHKPPTIPSPPKPPRQELVISSYEFQDLPKTKWWKVPDLKDILSEKRRVLLRAYLGEFTVTFLFLFCVMAVGVNSHLENLHSPVLGGLATGFTSVALIYSFADISGAHFNPAVTFSTIVSGHTSIRKGLWYIGMQLLASVLATLWLDVVFPRDDALPKASQLAVVIVPPSSTFFNVFYMEFTLTCILVLVIFCTAFDTVDTSNKIEVGDELKQAEAGIGRHLTIYTTTGNTKAANAPLAIGFTLGFLCFIGSSSSGGVFNPARAFGPGLVTGRWSHQGLIWFADLLGGTFAALLHQVFFAHKAVQTSGAVANSL